MVLEVLGSPALFIFSPLIPLLKDWERKRQNWARESLEKVLHWSQRSLQGKDWDSNHLGWPTSLCSPDKYCSGLWLYDNHLPQTYSPFPWAAGRKRHTWHWASLRTRQDSINPRNELWVPTCQAPPPTLLGLHWQFMSFFTLPIIMSFWLISRLKTCRVSLISVSSSEPS